MIKSTKRRWLLRQNLALLGQILAVVPMISMNDGLNRKTLRQALRALDSLQTLGDSPLAQFAVVTARRRAAGYADTVAGRGLALCEVLREAVASTRPEAGEPQYREKRWRAYIILTEQFLNGRKPGWVWAQLFISRRTYYHEQEKALDALLDILRQWEAQQQEQPVAAPAARQAAPFIAPPRPSYRLVGRDGLLQEVKQQLLDSDGHQLVVLNGLPGVGKTAIAIALAHDPHLLDHFSDGVLWAGLGRRPDLMALLAHWARTLGVPASDVTPCQTPVELARVVHAAIGLRRMLLIIDDAWQAEAGLAFKVGGPHCAHLFTTRLAPVAWDITVAGGTAVRELEIAQGLDLLGEVGGQAVTAEPEAARALVGAVGGLPLALVLIGRHLQKQSRGGQLHRLHRALAQLQEVSTRLRLSQPQPPLQQHPDLPQGAPLSLQAVIDISNEALPPPAREALKSLSLFPPKPNSFTEEAILAITSLSLDLLDALVDHGLLEYVGDDRYTIHQTISDYARLQPAPAAAVSRFAAYYVTYIQANENEYERLTLELANLPQALDLARRQAPDRLIAGVQGLYAYWMSYGRYQAADEYLTQALDAARAQGDATAVARLLQQLGGVAQKTARPPLARQHFSESIQLARQHDLLQVEADSLRQLGTVFWYTREYEQAAANYELALQRYRQIGDRHGESAALNNLGLIAFGQGDFDRARPLQEEALQLAQSLDNRLVVAQTSNNLGLIARYEYDHYRALLYYREVLQISRNIDERMGITLALGNIGATLASLGSLRDAIGYCGQALQRWRDSGDRAAEGTMLLDMARIHYDLGEYETAQAHLQEVPGIMREVGDKYYLARALTLQGYLLTELGHFASATAVLQEALALFRAAKPVQRIVEPLAGLVQVCLRQPQPQPAAPYLAEIWPVIMPNLPIGLHEPFQVYAITYRALTALQDERAPLLLQKASCTVETLSQKISDPELRQTFRQQLPAQRFILNTSIV